MEQLQYLVPSSGLGRDFYYTYRAETCYAREVAEDSIRLNVTLAPEVGEKLARIASRTQVREGTIASSLLAQAIEEADPDATRIVDLLDRIPAAWDRIEAGIEDVRAGRTIPFDSRQ
jgi:predicted transcriptional regulator